MTRIVEARTADGGRVTTSAKDGSARMKRLGERVRAWDERRAAERVRDIDFTTTSSMEVAPLYTPLDTAHIDPLEDIGCRGSSRYARGVYDTMYRTRLWTMRQFAGFGTAEDTNERYHYLLEHGQTGLSVAFDFPTLMGYDSDHPRSEGEVGECGVAIRALADMERLFEGIPLDQVSTSMTINGPAILFSRSTSRRRRSRASLDEAPRHGPERHPEGVHGAARVAVPARAAAQDHRRHVRVVRRERAQVEHDLDLGLPHPRGGSDGGAGARVHARRRLHVRGARDRARASTSTRSRRGSRSSGTSTTTSSRRSPSCARPGGSGRGT